MERHLTITPVRLSPSIETFPDIGGVIGDGAVCETIFFEMVHARARPIAITRRGEASKSKHPARGWQASSCHRCPTGTGEISAFSTACVPVVVAGAWSILLGNLYDPFGGRIPFARPSIISEWIHPWVSSLISQLIDHQSINPSIH